MDFTTIINGISSFITIMQGGIGAGKTAHDLLDERKKGTELIFRDWDSDDGEVQSEIDKFKSKILSNYPDHIFSDEEIKSIQDQMLQQSKFSLLSPEQKKQAREYIKQIIEKLNENKRSNMSPDGKIIADIIKSELDGLRKDIEKKNGSKQAALSSDVENIAYYAKSLKDRSRNLFNANEAYSRDLITPRFSSEEKKVIEAYLKKL